MSYKSLLVSLAIFQILCIVQGHIPGNDLAQRFIELHGIFSSWENARSDSFSILLDHINQTQVNENDRLYYFVMNNTYIIKAKMLEFLHDTGMADHVDMVQHCSKQNKDALLLILRKNYVPQIACLKMVETSFKMNVTGYMTVLYNEIEEEHVILESSREQCTKKVDPLDIDTCLTNNLYSYYVLDVKVVEAEVKRRLLFLKNDISFLLNRLNKCYDIVMDQLKADMFKVLNDYKICVSEAKTAF